VSDETKPRLPLLGIIAILAAALLLRSTALAQGGFGLTLADWRRLRRDLQHRWLLQLGGTIGCTTPARSAAARTPSGGFGSA
jgi:hypothetical protein